MAADLPERLPAITIWQPFASLIMAGLKIFEFRDWWHKFDAREIAIHAGVRKPPRHELQELLYWLDRSGGAPFCGRYLAREDYSHAGTIIRMGASLPRGALLGTVTLEPARAVEAVFNDLYGAGAWKREEVAGAKFAWPVRNPLRREPTECRGRQGFFEIDTPKRWLSDV